MSVRQVTFLGTASQVPTRSRNHNAVFLQWDELGVLFDPGEGTHVCVTHFHGDHCLGLAGVIQRLSLDRVAHPVEVIYPASGQAFFERLRHASAFHEVATLAPRAVTLAPGEMLTVSWADKVRILAAALEHGIDCQGYRVQEDDGVRMVPAKLAAAGVTGPAVRQLMQAGHVRVGERLVQLGDVSEARPGQAFAFVMDTRPCAGAEALARGVDLLVCEATYQHAEAREAHDHFHLTARQAAELAVAAGARRLALTHFSQRYASLTGFQEEASAVHPDVSCAEDLSQVSVPKRREQGV